MTIDNFGAMVDADEGLETGTNPERVRRELSKKEKEELFVKEFYPHADALYNFAMYLKPDEDIAKDLVQETLFRAYKFIEYYQVGTHSKAWLLRILKNTYINDYRKLAKQPQKVSLEETYQQADESESDGPVLDLRQEVYDALVGDEIMEAVNTLQIEYRLILLLCDIENFKYDEIAMILDIPIGTVRSRLHRARQILKEKLRDYAQKKGYKVKD